MRNATAIVGFMPGGRLTVNLQVDGRPDVYIRDAVDYVDGQVRVQTDDTSVAVQVSLAVSHALKQQECRRRLWDTSVTSVRLRILRDLTVRVEGVNENG